MNKILIGLLAGIAVGVLLAPDKGSVLRQKVSEGFKDFVDNLKAVADKIKDETEDVMNESGHPAKMNTDV